MLIRQVPTRPLAAAVWGAARGRRRATRVGGARRCVPCAAAPGRGAEDCRLRIARQLRVRGLEHQRCRAVECRTLLRVGQRHLHRSRLGHEEAVRLRSNASASFEATNAGVREARADRRYASRTWCSANRSVVLAALAPSPAFRPVFRPSDPSFRQFGVRDGRALLLLATSAWRESFFAFISPHSQPSTQPNGRNDHRQPRKHGVGRMRFRQNNRIVPRIVQKQGRSTDRCGLFRLGPASQGFHQVLPEQVVEVVVGSGARMHGLEVRPNQQLSRRKEGCRCTKRISLAPPEPTLLQETPHVALKNVGATRERQSRPGGSAARGVAASVRLGRRV